MRLMSMRGDHVVAAMDGSIGEYAVGHLPPSAQALIRAPGVIRASLADGQKRTMLGILSEKAVDDIHDEDPGICPVTLAIIRAHARDPEGTIRAFMAAAPHVGSITGQETSLQGGGLVYEVSQRRLTVEWRGGNWSLLRDRIEIDEVVPATFCVAAIGRPMALLVEHPAFKDAGAVITGVKPESWGTEIHYETTPVRARILPEARARRRSQ